MNLDLEIIRNPRAAVRVEEMTHDIHTARKNGETGYVAAQFEPHRLRGSFTVGDNKTYDGYFNGPLEKDKEYTFWLIAFSNIDGVSWHINGHIISFLCKEPQVQICNIQLLYQKMESID